jgi:hypothetical protein
MYTFGSDKIDLKAWKKTDIKMDKETALAIARAAIKYQIYAMELERNENTVAYRATEGKMDHMINEYKMALDLLNNMDI